MIFRYGKCEKAGCSCTKPRAKRSKRLGFKMCECGHPFEVHAIRSSSSVSSEDCTSTSGLNHVVSSKKVFTCEILGAEFHHLFGGVFSYPLLRFSRRYPQLCLVIVYTFIRTSPKGRALSLHLISLAIEMATTYAFCPRAIKPAKDQGNCCVAHVISGCWSNLLSHRGLSYPLRGQVKQIARQLVVGEVTIAKWLNLSQKCLIFLQTTICLACTCHS